jgi:hypothetical protein
VSFWVARAKGHRLDRVDFADRKPGCARGWNRTAIRIEQRIVELRRSLREESVLGEYGARAIQAALKAEMADAPSEVTINRVLSRSGLQDAVRRIRRPAPPQGWYLPEVVAGRAEIDCFDFIEDLKIADGPLVDALTAKPAWELTDAWMMAQKVPAHALPAAAVARRTAGLPSLITMRCFRARISSQRVGASAACACSWE